jgi:hypothetical protein
MTDITRFKAIFSGLDIAYGTYKIEGSRGDGKQSGKAVVVRKPPTDDLWEKHLQGVEPSLGIIPIRADNTCIWGCIDIDQYPLDHLGLSQRFANLICLWSFAVARAEAHTHFFLQKNLSRLP